SSVIQECIAAISIAAISFDRSEAHAPFIERSRAMNRTALIIGATGGIGSEVARALIAHGWHVRAMHRDPAQGAKRAGSFGPIEWVKGDAMNAKDVIAAAAGADVIVHAANPPGYKNWKGLAIPMLESTIAAARTSGARVVLPGTVYNFGVEELPL